jgi:putative endonuclease
MPFFTYILYSRNFDRFYYGQTEDLHARLASHNSGKVKSTAPYIPWCIFAYKKLSSRAEALKILIPQKTMDYGMNSRYHT